MHTFCLYISHTNTHTQEMKDEVTFKEKQLESSQVTMTRLGDERTKRLQELEKIDTLDEKIASELKLIEEKVIVMEKGE